MENRVRALLLMLCSFLFLIFIPCQAANKNYIDLRDFFPRSDNILVFAKKSTYSNAWVWYVSKGRVLHQKGSNESVICDNYLIDTEKQTFVKFSTDKIDFYDDTVFESYVKKFGIRYKGYRRGPRIFVQGEAYQIPSTFIGARGEEKTTGHIKLSKLEKMIFPKLDPKLEFDACLIEIGNEEYASHTYSWAVRNFGTFISALDLNPEKPVEYVVYYKSADVEYGKKPVWLDKIIKKLP